jgi:hypothetical protein
MNIDILSFTLPDITPKERTPLVLELLQIIEQQQICLKQQQTYIGQLTDEIKRLKDHNTKPQNRASVMDQNTDLPEAESKGNHSSRPQRKIRSKTSQLKIDETIKVETKNVHEGSIFKGYQDYIVQALIIKTHNTKYQLERWQTPDGTYIISPAPIKGHFGPTLESFINKLIPLNDNHSKAIDWARCQIWDLYSDLKAYKKEPTSNQKVEITNRFKEVCKTTTGFETLNQALKRLQKNKSELLLVLERPELPLHNNHRYRDIRDYVKKRKISGSTRSYDGRRCRDTFASLKKTCRKHGISFWEYLKDRLAGANAVLPLPKIIRRAATMK